jgi:hypothetical protein
MKIPSSPLRRLPSWALAVCILATSACGRPFDVHTPRGFVELEHQAPAYDYRATTADGVVVAVRAIDAADRDDLSFWSNAVTVQMRDASGYALLRSKDVRSADGTPGRELVFGHDENGTPYLYRVALFTAQDRVFLLEAGGTRDAVERTAQHIDWQIATFHARCGFFLAPLLASRTCNRW